MFDWLKHWLKQLFIKKQETKEEITVHFVLPDGKKFDAVDLKVELNKDLCKKHPEYTGLKSPTNNCNDCWEYHSKRFRR